MAALGHRDRMTKGGCTCQPRSGADEDSAASACSPAASSAAKDLRIPHQVPSEQPMCSITPPHPSLSLAAAAHMNRVPGTQCAMRVTRSHLPAHDAQTAKADAATARSAACTSPSWLCPLPCGLFISGARQRRWHALPHGTASYSGAMHNTGAGLLRCRMAADHGAYLWLGAGGAAGAQARAEVSARQSAGLPNTACQWQLHIMLCVNLSKCPLLIGRTQLTGVGQS
jgi:hypothetical protein